jgi:site-specific recombinase XerD
MMMEAFLDALSIEGKSVETIKLYRGKIRRLLEYSGTAARCITTYHIRQFLADEKARGLKDSTLQNTRNVLSSFFGWLHRDGLIQRNPIWNISPIKVQKRVKEVYSDVDYERLKDGCKRLRDKAIVMFLRSSMCRISEVVRLNRDDVDLSRLRFIALGKGNKERVAYIDEVTADVLKQYLDSRTDDLPALFIGQKMNRLTDSGVRNMLRVLAGRMDVEHAHPHKFRTTTITNLVARGMAIERVAQLAGHERIDTTMRYVKVNQNQVENDFRKFA